MVDTIHKIGLQPSAAIIITAKHGQSPQDPLLLKRIPDGPIISAINEVWCEQQNPNAKPDPTTYCTNGLSAATITPLIVAGTDHVRLGWTEGRTRRAVARVFRSDGVQTMRFNGAAAGTGRAGSTPPAQLAGASSIHIYLNDFPGPDSSPARRSTESSGYSL